MEWREILDNPQLDTHSKTRRITELLRCEYGDNKATLYSGTVIYYKITGEGSSIFAGTEIEEIWQQTKDILDADRKKRKAKTSARIEQPPKPSSRSFSEEPSIEDADELVESLFPTDINKACGLGDRPASTEGKQYISDVIDMREIVGGKLNIIFAPPGSGKTFFTEGALKKYAEFFSHELLYLAPTRSLVDSLKFRGTPRKTSLPNGNQVVRWSQEGIIAMTYASFGSQIEREHKEGTYCRADWWHDDALICLDELSTAVHQAYYTKGRDNNVTMKALEELVQRCKNKTNVVVTLSATPKATVDYYYFWNKVDINLIKSTSDLEGYKNGETIGYLDWDNLLASLDPSQRGMVFASQIKQVKHAVDILESRGVRAVGIWSDKNKDYPMSKDQLRVAKSIIREEKIPDDVQVLVFNSAYEIGLNIRPEKSHLDYVVVHDSNKDKVIQARGRYRGDVDILYKKEVSDQSEGFVRKVDDEILAPFLGKRLGSEEKNRIKEALNFRDDRGRLIGWPKVAEQIENNGYFIAKIILCRMWVVCRLAWLTNWALACRTVYTGAFLGNALPDLA